MDSVSVMKLKRPVGSGLWGAYVLGSDDFGTWLHTPAGSIYRGEDGHHTGVCEVAQDSHGVGRSIVQLIPPEDWWIATFYPPTADLDVTVDICTPAILDHGTWKYTDLELDPWRSRDGAVATGDWPDFRAAHDAGWITDDEAETCMVTAKTMEVLLRKRTEPFDQVGMARLAVATELCLPRRD